MARHGTAVGIVRALRAAGVDRVFFVTGGDQPLWIALKEEGFHLVLARSEAAAVAMADGYARVTGRAGVVYGQWGPGAANVAAALADAYWARSPVVALTSSVPASSQGKFAYQELEQLGLFTSVTKWNQRVPEPARAAEFASKAVAAALGGCPGPVHLDIPKDWLASDEELVVPRPPRAPTVPAPTSSAIERVAALLRDAERPLLLAGNGVLLARAENALVTAAERWVIPVATSMGGKGAIGEGHPLAVGVTGRYSRKVANDLVREADVVLAVGTDLGGMVTDGYRLPSATAAVVQVDVDAARIGVSRPDAMGVVADAREFLVRLADATDGSATQAAWVEHAQASVAGWQAELSRIADEPANGHLGHEETILTLREFAHPHDVLIADTGFVGAWAGALWPVPDPGRYFLRAAGTLGWSFAAALGVQVALPERRAICLIGDGGIGYNLGDLETALRLRIPVVTVVLNNHALAYEYLVQKYLYDTVVPEVNDFAEVDFSAVARAMGMAGHGASTPAELRTALAASFAAREPALIDVRVSRERMAPTTSFEGRLERIL